MTRIKVTGKLGESLRADAQPGIVIPLVKNMLLAKHGPNTERRTDVIHPSEMAKSDWCARATWLRIKGDLTPPVEKFDFIRQNIFGEGTTIHEKWQGWLKESDPRFMAEIPLEYGMVSGHADGGMDDWLLEIKSVGLGSIRIDAPEFLSRYQKDGKTDLTGLWRGLERPLKSHLRQGDVYLWLASKLGLPFNKIVYLYEFKANQMVKEFTTSYNEERVQPLIDKVDMIEDAMKLGMEVPCNISLQGCDQCRAVKPRKVRRVIR